MDIYQELIRLIKNNKLKCEQKITLCYRQEFGELAVCKTKFYHCEKEPTYNNCPADTYILKIYHIPVGKRNMRITKIASQSCIVIFDGYIDIDVEDINYNISYKEGLKIMESKYTHFSNEVFKDLVEKYPDYILGKV